MNYHWRITTKKTAKSFISYSRQFADEASPENSKRDFQMIFKWFSIPKNYNYNKKKSYSVIFKLKQIFECIANYKMENRNVIIVAVLILHLVAFRKSFMPLPFILFPLLHSLCFHFQILSIFVRELSNACNNKCWFNGDLTMSSTGSFPCVRHAGFLVLSSCSIPLPCTSCSFSFCVGYKTVAGSVRARSSTLTVCMVPLMSSGQLA